MRITTVVCGIAAALVAGLSLWAGRTHEAWAQTKPAAATETPAPLVVTARGAWSPSINYVKDDLVTARGSAWRAKRANLNKIPGQTSPSTALDWERFARGFNPLGGWVSSKTYQPDDLVLRQGSTWRALRTNLNVTPGLSPQDWQQFAAQGAPGGNSVANGSAGAPSINFASDHSTGIFSPGAGKIAMSAGGTLFLHNIGSGTTALGAGALDSNIIGGDNTAFGDSALGGNTSGDGNTAIGASALATNTTGDWNTAVGASALRVNTGSQNTAIGTEALGRNSTGSNNNAIGRNALLNNTTGANNVALGRGALFSNTTGINNTAVGDGALTLNTTGGGNIALGLAAGFNPTAPNSSIFIGNAGDAGDTTTIKIGTQGTQTTAFIAGISGVTVANAAFVLINPATGQLGTVLSSRRYKEDIQPMADASAALMKLRPVTFHYKKAYVDGPKPLEYGLIAEEVAEVLPDLAVFNQDGSPETVKYHLLPSLLLNEVQGQQRTIERQEQTIQSQAEQIAAQAEQMAALERRLLSLEARLSPAQHAASRID